MNWGGGLGQKWGKKHNGYSPGKKKLNSTTRKKKIFNSRLARKKYQQSVGRGKKTQLSAHPPPQIINGPSLRSIQIMWLHDYYPQNTECSFESILWVGEAKGTSTCKNCIPYQSPKSMKKSCHLTSSPLDWKTSQEHHYFIDFGDW